MQYFQTDKGGFLTGAGVADVSPLEPEILDDSGAVLSPAVFLIPGGGVVEAPPVLAAFECAKWNGAEWAVLPDIRGRAYFTADHVRHVVENRGESVPAGAFDTDPPLTQAEIDAAISNAAKAELVALDAASIRDIRAYITAKADAPQTLKAREAAAVIARGKVKP